MKSTNSVKPLKINTTSASRSGGLVTRFLNRPLVVANLVLVAMLSFGTFSYAETPLLPGTSIIVMGLDKELGKLEQLVKG
jgi:hypothetical protein